MRLKHVRGLKGNTEFGKTNKIKFEEFQDYMYYYQQGGWFCFTL